MVPSTSTATDLSTRRAFVNPPPAAAPVSSPAPALDAAAQQVANTNILNIVSAFYLIMQATHIFTLPKTSAMTFAPFVATISFSKLCTTHAAIVK